MCESTENVPPNGESKNEFYRGKVMLAPMVRINTLPMRLLCLRYGAPIVYSEEIIDFKILNTKRVVNENLGTIDYMCKDGSVAFRTCEEERGKLVFQVGTADAERAVKVLKHLEQDIAAFDVNMGCPREFSVKGGMGAALLDKPDLVESIMKNLVENSSIPISCKIRILPDEQKTLDLVEKILNCKVNGVGIHGRFRGELSAEPCHVDRIKQITDRFGNEIPFIANGGSLDIKTMDDAWKFAEECGASSVMLARAPEWDPSIFRREGPLDHMKIVAEYLQLAVKYDNRFGNTKYVVSKMVGNKISNISHNIYNQTIASNSYRELCAIYDVKYSEENVGEKVFKRRFPFAPEIPIPEKISKLNMNLVVKSVDIGMKEIKQNQRNSKSILNDYAKKTNKELLYDTVQSGPFFKCYLYFDNVAYTSSYLFKNKRTAEQASAKVCCITRELISQEN